MQTVDQSTKIQVDAVFEKKELLNQKGSSKSTFHVVLKTEKPALFVPGDSIAVYPKNSDAVVDLFLEKTGFSGKELVFPKKSGQKISFKTFLKEKANLQKATRRFCACLDLAFSKDASTAVDLIDLLPKKACKIDVQTLTDSLLPMTPRFYSIASSSLYRPFEIHLTVALASYEVKGNIRYGLGSSYLCHSLQKGDLVQGYIQAAKDFHLPKDPNAPIVMIGPGTGIAPFRAFLEERAFHQSEGNNWLIFGERQKAYDFYYQNDWEELSKKIPLQITSVFSRDQEEKRYVQDALFANRKKLISWMEKGAILYICGDAKNMAKDVLEMLKQIASKEKGLSEEQSSSYIRDLKKTKRLLLDVY